MTFLIHLEHTYIRGRCFSSPLDCLALEYVDHFLCHLYQPQHPKWYGTTIVWQLIDFYCSAYPGIGWLLLSFPVFFCHLIDCISYLFCVAVSYHICVNVHWCPHLLKHCVENLWHLGLESQSRLNRSCGIVPVSFSAHGY